MKILILYGEKHLRDVWTILDYLENEWDHTVSIQSENVNDFGYIMSDYDLAISYYYPYILSEQIINSPRYGTINCHPSFLPFNRGVHTNVWPIVDCTPAGVSIHKMTKSLDRGNVLAKKEVEVTDYHDGYSLYQELSQEMIQLLISIWSLLQKYIDEHGCLPNGEEQDNDVATFHRISDLQDIQNLSSYFTMSEMTTIREFIDIVRACTFDEYDGAYIINEDGEKVYYKLIPHKEGEG